MTNSLVLPLQLTAVSIGLLVFRIVIGLSIAAHGSQKLFGWFGGHGLAGTGGFFEMIGFKPGRILPSPLAQPKWRVVSSSRWASSVPLGRRSCCP